MMNVRFLMGMYLYQPSILHQIPCEADQFHFIFLKCLSVKRKLSFIYLNNLLQWLEMVI